MYMTTNHLTNYSTSLSNEMVCEKPHGQRDHSLFIGGVAGKGGKMGAHSALAELFWAGA